MTAQEREQRALADQFYLAALAIRGWSSWVSPPEQQAQCAQLWEEAKKQAQEFIDRR